MDTIDWLLDSDEPWTRYHAHLDLLDGSLSNPVVAEARRDMLQHPDVCALLARAATWGEAPVKRHNDAAHPLYAISTLADFGLQSDDPGMDAIIARVLAHRASEGAFQSVINIPGVFGGDDTDRWTWLACDAPTLLYSLLAFGLGADPSVQQAVVHLLGLVNENGWRCVCDPALGKFRGPGRKDDPCPIANVYALKALFLLPDAGSRPEVRAGAEMLLSHWEKRKEKKFYLFGMGTDFQKLKYPFVWYDILHVMDVLSRFPFVHADPRFREMLAVITAQANTDGRYTVGSMYQSWKGWSFSDKKNPSPWLTFLVLRILKRVGV